jgi:hypothetical protein
LPSWPIVSPPWWARQTGRKVTRWCVGLRAASSPGWQGVGLQMSRCRPLRGLRALGTARRRRRRRRPRGDHGQPPLLCGCLGRGHATDRMSPQPRPRSTHAASDRRSARLPARSGTYVARGDRLCVMHSRAFVAVRSRPGPAGHRGSWLRRRPDRSEPMHLFWRRSGALAARGSSAVRLGRAPV